MCSNCNSSGNYCGNYYVGGMGYSGAYYNGGMYGGGCGLSYNQCYPRYNQCYNPCGMYGYRGGYY